MKENYIRIDHLNEPYMKINTYYHIDNGCKSKGMGKMGDKIPNTALKTMFTNWLTLKKKGAGRGHDRLKNT